MKEKLIIITIVSLFSLIFLISASAILVYSLLFFPVENVEYNQYYVATWGNDENNPGTITSPWRTIDYAVDNLPNGCTVWVMNGIYIDDYITISSSGNATHPKSIRKYNGTVLIDGKNANGTGISMNGHSYWNIQGIDIKNVEKVIYLSGNDTHHLNLSDCEISYFISPISINKGAHNITLHNISIHTLFSGDSNLINILGDYSDPTKVTKDIVIRNCNIYNNTQHNGINFGPATGGGDSRWIGKYVIDRVRIENNTIYGITQQAVFNNWVTVNNLTFINNTIYNSGKGVRITVEDSQILNNEVYNIFNGNPMALQFENARSKNVLFDKNYIHDCPYSSEYYAIELRKGDNITVSNLTQSGMGGHVSSYSGSARDRIIKDIFTDIYNIDIKSGPAGVTIEYTNSDVFELSGSGNIKGPQYYPHKSSAIITTNNNNHLTVNHYNMTVRPKRILSDVTINSFDQSADEYEWTATSIHENNTVWFNISVKREKSKYTIYRDSSFFKTITSNSNGILEFLYTKSGPEWKKKTHTFRLTCSDN